MQKYLMGITMFLYCGQVNMIPKINLDFYTYLLAIDEDNILEIRDFIPDLYEKHNTEVKCELINIIGNFKLIEHVDLLKREIKITTSKIILCYAMTSLYELLELESLEYIRGHRKLRYKEEKLTFKCLGYLSSNENKSLDEIKEVVLNPNCEYHLQYLVLHTFGSFMDIKSDKKLVEMFKKIMQISIPEHGIYKDIQKILDE